MAYNVENTLAGIKANGRAWKGTIHGFRDILKEIDEAYEAENLDRINELTKLVGTKFQKHWDEEKASMSEQEDLEWFLEENCNWFVEEYGNLEGWRDEFNYRLNSLYDWADYNRIWIEPN